MAKTKKKPVKKQVKIKAKTKLPVTENKQNPVLDVHFEAKNEPVKAIAKPSILAKHLGLNAINKQVSLLNKKRNTLYKELRKIDDQIDGLINVRSMIHDIE